MYGNSPDPNLCLPFRNISLFTVKIYYLLATIQGTGLSFVGFPGLLVQYIPNYVYLPHMEAISTISKIIKKISCCCVWVWSLVSHTEGGMWSEGAQEDVWA
jgi:hypothetical protein